MLLPIGLEVVIITGVLHHVRVRIADVRVGNYGFSTSDLLALHPIPDLLALQLAQFEPEVHVLAHLALGERLILKNIGKCRSLR